MTDENTTPALPGERLRRQRERRGLTLAQVSSELHVDQRMLAALEADDFAMLGAPIFVKGHLRSYARLLGLDPAELIAAYEAAQQPAAPTLVAHRPDGVRMDAHRSQAWVGWFGWIFLLVLGLLLAGWWYYQQEGGADFVISNVPEQTGLFTESRRPEPAVEETEKPATTGDDAATAGDEAGTAPAEDAPATDNGAPAAAAGSAAEQPGEQAATPQLTAPAMSQPASPARGRGLVLEFNEESWVEIYDAEGRPILYDLLAAGTRREISASGQLRVFLGNAEGVEVYFGGETYSLERHRRSDNTARFTVNVPPARN